MKVLLSSTVTTCYIDLMSIYVRKALQRLPMAHLTTFLSRRFRAQSRGPLSSPFKKRRIFAAIADFKPLFDSGSGALEPARAR